jgi:integrase
VLGRFPGVGATAARQLAMAAAGDVARGIDILARRRQARAESVRALQSTLQAFLGAPYEPWAMANLKTGKFQLQRIRADFKSWLEKPMPEINAGLVEGWRQRRRAAGNCPVTINRGLQRLHAVLAKAVEWKVIDTHPFTGLKPLRHDRTGHARYLRENEEARLREALLEREGTLRKERDSFNEWLRARGRTEFPRHTGEFVDHLRPLVLLALNTGLRRGELFHLEWRDVDLIGRWLTVTGSNAKSGQTRRIPLNAEAVRVMKAWHRQNAKAVKQPRVFPGVGGHRLTTINTAWRNLRTAAELGDFRFHDLRHHFASRLVQSGIDLNTVRELLGHADITMVLRYAHMSPDRLSMAVEKVARTRRKARGQRSTRADTSHDTAVETSPTPM